MLVDGSFQMLTLNHTTGEYEVWFERSDGTKLRFSLDEYELLALGTTTAAELLAAIVKPKAAQPAAA